MRAKREQQVAFPDARPVRVIDGIHPDEPLHRLERRLTLEQVEGNGRVVRISHLIPAPEELRAVRERRADSAGHGQLAHFKKGEVLGRKIEEDVLPKDRHVALQLALAIGMPEPRGVIHVRRFRGHVPIALPVGKRDEPAIRHAFRMRQETQSFATERIGGIGECLLNGIMADHVAARQLQRARHDRFLREKQQTVRVRLLRGLIPHARIGIEARR